MQRHMLPIAFALAAGAVAQDVPMPPEFEGVRRRIEAGIQEGLSSSCAVAVVRDGKVVWAEGFGLADREKGRKADADTIYLLASVSKPLTATGLMVAVERGLVDLDAPANRYLEAPGLRAHLGSAEEMTVRRLANHTSGLPEHWSFFFAGAGPPAMEETIRRHGFAAWAPGTRWNYSNLAFGILGHIVERASKTPWRTWMEKNVFDPAGMTRTSDRVRPGSEGDAAVPYLADAAVGFAPLPPYAFDHPGASAFWSSAKDLARFLVLHLQDGEVDGARVLGAAAARAMRAAEGSGVNGRTGIGWGLDSAGGRPRFGHTGGMPGVATVVRGFPESKCGHVILTNTSRRALVDELDGLLTGVLGGSEAKRPAIVSPLPKPPAPKKEPGALAGTWKGRIAHWAGDVAVTLAVPADGSRATLGTGPRAEGHFLDDTETTPESLTGSALFRIPTQDGYPGVPRVIFRLRREEDRLVGTATAQVAGCFNLPHWVELARDASSSVSGSASASASAPALAPDPTPSAAAPAAKSGHLVIVGGGGTPDGLPERVLALARGAATRVAVLPQASARDGAGAKSVEMWTKAGAAEARIVAMDDPAAAVAAIRAADVVWFPGGVQARLMEALPAEVEDAIRARHGAGGVIGGTSAGAAVMSKVMIASDDKAAAPDAPAALLGEGLGLWPEAIVDQHFSQRRRQPRLLGAIAGHPALLGVGIDEATAVIVSGDTAEVFGRNTVSVIRILRNGHTFPARP